MSDSPTLRVAGLAVAYGRAQVVDGVGFDLAAGRITGMVGESGCGKSTSALAAIGYVPPGGRILAGRAELEGRDLLTLPHHALREVWGRDVAYVAQNAGTALNPALTVGRQLADPLRAHAGLRGRELRARTRELLEAVGLPRPDQALTRFPHQFSGGQQQRIALAVALACQPRVLVLDEPTTGLDVTTQAMVARLLRRLVSDLGIAALYVSHDIALLGDLADDLLVMYGGEVVERGPLARVRHHPRHPYTQALLAAVPSVSRPQRLQGIPGEPPPAAVTTACAFATRCTHVVDACRHTHPDLVAVGPAHDARCLRLDELGPPPEGAGLAVPGGEEPGTAAPLLTVEGLVCAYRRGRDADVVVDGVALELQPGETLGVVGESGSGKSTLLRAIAGLHVPRAGRVTFDGEELAPDVRHRPRAVLRGIQLVFQDPASSLNPRETVATAITRPIRTLRSDVPRGGEDAEVAALLAAVGLPRTLATRYPWELSGGQQQRVALARALACQPRLLLCDEVTSALDVSVQASMIELLREVTARRGIAVLFVSHDLAVVRALAARMIVMRDGRVCETGTANQLFAAPEHPYTAELLAAVRHA